MQQTYSIKIDNKKEDIILNYLLDNRWLSVVDNNQYVKYKYVKDKTTIIIYTSSKVVVQGSGNEYDSILNLLDNNSSTLGAYIPHIGADEVGKGDYFGPLIVCACYIPKDNYEKIINIGVNDSKKITDRNIVKIYESIKDDVVYSIQILTPFEYNKEYLEDNNIAILLSKLHAKNIINLVNRIGVDKYNNIVIDQFSSRKDRLEKVLKGYIFDQYHKAESKDIVVATASVIARYYFIDYMNKLNEEYNMVFPYGSSHVIAFAKEFIDRFSLKELDKVAKTSFSITSQL